MKYVIDNDLHIHSHLSTCSSDPMQTNEGILRYAVENGIRTICLTNHFWDEGVEGASSWYEPQNYEHISSALPLPQDENVRFLFGCETELDKNNTLGISKEKMDLFDFIVIPTTHFHLKNFTMREEDLQSPRTRAAAWIRRFDAVLDKDLPFYKVGIAHLTCRLIAPTREECLETIGLIPEDEMKRLFSKAARLGCGIELNSSDMNFAEEEADIILRPYKIAKMCGCKFYCGSDAHKIASFEKAVSIFERAVTLLGLTEEDKFEICKTNQ